MAFTLPAIQIAVPVVDPKTGQMTAYFNDWLTRVLRQLQDQINTNSSLLAQVQAQQATLLAAIQQLQAVQAATAQAQATADAAGGGGAQSGFATTTFNVGIGWSNGPQVDLTGVAAGNLTIAGSGPTQGTGTYVDQLGDFNGEWRIQEIVGFVETTVMTGTFVAGAYFDAESGTTSYYLYNQTDTTMLSYPQASTGAVSYRLDLQMLQPVSVFFVPTSLYVRRA